MLHVYVSHTDAELAASLVRLIRRSLGNQVGVFSSSPRDGGGLASGQPIDATLLEKIKTCDAFVWLATPESTQSSFWMAWELGAADASDRHILPCRALGITTDQLPLFLSRRHVTDLGHQDDLIHFLENLADALGISGAPIAESVDNFYKTCPDHNPFEASRADALEVTLAGDRLIVENKTQFEVGELSFHGPSQELLEKRAGASPLIRQLGRVGGLAPFERKLGTLSLSSNDVEALRSMQIKASWLDKIAGRKYQHIQLRLHD